MLSSNCHVTLRLTVFEIFAVKWTKFRPKISDVRIPGASPPKSDKICPGPICTIVQNFTPIGATVAEISVTGQRNSNLSSLPYQRMAGKKYVISLEWKSLGVTDAESVEDVNDDSTKCMRKWIMTRLMRLTTWIWKLIAKTRWCISKCVSWLWYQ